MPLRRSKQDRNILTSPFSPPTASLAVTRVRRVTSNAQLSREVYEQGTGEGEGRDNENSKRNIGVGLEGTHPREPRRTFRITVKMPSNRLREATSSVTQDRTPVPSGRTTRNIKKSYVVETSSEEDEDEDEEQEDYDDLNDELGDEATPNALQDDEEDEEEIEEDDDIDADGDLEMDEDADDGVPLGHQPPLPLHTPILRVNPPAAPQSKPKVTVTPAQDTKLKSVESKEMEMDEDDDDDEELSELGSDDEEEVDEEDAEGEEEEEEEEREDEEEGEEEEDAEGEEVEDDEDMAEADDSRSPDLLSRGTTPDINKMTKRQRSRLNEVLTASDAAGGAGDFLELPMEPQVKKHLTAEEHAMRRAEMARRRKNLSEKRNEEEKQDTINRLLKKQAPKRRGKISAKEIEAQDRGDMSEADEQVEEEMPILPANPIFVRWTSNARGCRVGVPTEWFGAPIGKIFGDLRGGGNLVEEVES